MDYLALVSLSEELLTYKINKAADRGFRVVGGIAISAIVSDNYIVSVLMERDKSENGTS